jgi:hypothetical protein
MTRYDIYYDAAVEGQIADSTFQRDVITMPNGTTPLAFGVAVTISGTSEYQARGSNPVVEKATSASTKILGISIFKQPTEPTYSIFTSSDNNSIISTYEYKASEPVGILTMGRVYVKIKAGLAHPVAAFDKAYIDSTGAFTNVATDNKEIGFFFTGGPSNGLAVLQINLSANAAAGNL